MNKSIWEIKRQKGSKQFGVFKNDALVEGGFFDVENALVTLDELVADEEAQRARTARLAQQALVRAGVEVERAQPVLGDVAALSILLGK
jgi:hypothetical protein